MSARTYTRCRYFNGIQHLRCLADVEYVSVRDSSGGGPYRWPCVTMIGNEPATTVCPRFSALTQQELDAEWRELVEASDRAIAANAAGKCHICGKQIEPSKVVGRCKYGACGHRIGQVMTEGEP